MKHVLWFSFFWSRYMVSVPIWQTCFVFDTDLIIYYNPVYCSSTDEYWLEVVGGASGYTWSTWYVQVCLFLIKLVTTDLKLCFLQLINSIWSEEVTNFSKSTIRMLLLPPGMKKVSPKCIVRELCIHEFSYGYSGIFMMCFNDSFDANVWHRCTWEVK